MVKFLPSVLPAALAVLSVFEPSIQGWLVAHPAIAAVAGAAVMVVNHVLPSPVQKAQ